MREIVAHPGGEGTSWYRRPIGRAALGGAIGLVLCLYVTDAATGWTGPGVHSFLRDWLVLALYLGAAASCLTRAVRVEADRAAWLLLGIGIACYAAAGLDFSLSRPAASVDPPLVSDVLWLAFYPAAVAAVVLLVVARGRRFLLGTWLDAGAAALSLAGVLTAIALPGIAHPVLRDSTIVVGTTFPALDTMLVTLALWVLSLAGWRPHRSWLLVTAAFVLLAVGDTAVSIRGAEGLYVSGDLASASFPLAMMMLGVAATRAPAPRLSEPLVSLRVLVLPGAAALTAVALLAVDLAHPISRLSAVLSVAAIGVAFTRAGSTTLEALGLYESRRYAHGFHNSALGLALVGWDMRWIQVNPALCRLLRCEPEDLVGRSVLDVTFSDDLRPVDQERARGLVDPERSTFNKRYVRSDGAVVNVEITTSLIEDAKVGTYFYTQIQDITDRCRAEERQALIADLGFRALDMTDVGAYLQHVTETLAEVLGAFACALLTPGEQDRLEYVAQTGPRADPYPSDSMAGWVLNQRRAIISNDLAGETNFRARTDLLDVVSRGIAVPVRARRPHVLLAGAPAGRDPFDEDDAHFLEAVANIVASVLDREQTDRELRQLAFVDSLTGLANRATLEDQLDRSLAEARHRGHSVAVLLLDVDNFKVVNDTLGHPAGDQLLQEVGARLGQAVRPGDLLARLGGDEFVVLSAVHGGERDVRGLADCVLSSFDEPSSWRATNCT